jgi:anti-sigma factor RsiW
LVGAEVAEARAHVADCSECAEFLDQDRALLDFYDKLRTETAPREVREKIFDTLAAARWDPRGDQRTEKDLLGSSRKRTAAWSFGVAIALAAIGFVDFSAATPPELADGTMFVEDYLRRAVGQDHITTSDPDEIGRFLTRELGMRLRPIQLEGLVLEGAEICLLEGRRGAMIVYRKNGAMISHYLVPREGAQLREPALSMDCCGATSKTPVVTWSTHQLEQALVGEISPEQLLSLAASSDR